MVKQMTSKDLHVALKRPDGIAYLLKKFAIDTEKSLLDVIRRVTPEHSEWFIKELTKKQKKRTHIIEQSSELIPKEDYSEPSETEASETIDTEKEDKSMRLDDLLREEEEMSYSLCLLEGLHKELASKRHSIRSNLEGEKAALIKLQEELDKREENAIRLHKEYIQCAEEMRKLNGDMRAYEELLAEVRKEIEVARRVIVLVYDTGVIEIENAEFPELPEEQVKAQFDMLIAMPEAEEVTIKCVKCVAKLRVMMPSFTDAEVIFDSEAVKALYEV